MYSNLTNWAYLFRYRKWKKQTNNAVLCNGTLSLLRHCSVSLLRTIFPRSQRAHVSPSFFPTLLPPSPARCPAQLTRSSSKSHQRCSDTSPFPLRWESWQLLRVPWHHQHLDGASRPSSQAQPRPLFSCLDPLQGQRCFHDTAWPLHCLTPSCPFLEELLSRGKRCRAAGPDNAGARAASDKPAQAAVPLGPSEGLRGRRSRPGWILPARLDPPGRILPATSPGRGRRGPSRPRHVLTDGRGRRARSRLPAGPAARAPGCSDWNPARSRPAPRGRAGSACRDTEPAPSPRRAVPPSPARHAPAFAPVSAEPSGPGIGPRSAAGSGPPPPSPAVPARRMRSPHRRWVRAAPRRPRPGGESRGAPGSAAPAPLPVRPGGRGALHPRRCPFPAVGRPGLGGARRGLRPSRPRAGPGKRRRRRTLLRLAAALPPRPGCSGPGEPPGPAALPRRGAGGAARRWPGRVGAAGAARGPRVPAWAGPARRSRAVRSLPLSCPPFPVL